jgi:hypothetical protein
MTAILTPGTPYARMRSLMFAGTPIFSAAMGNSPASTRSILGSTCDAASTVVDRSRPKAVPLML